jgi:hypothetical protein
MPPHPQVERVKGRRFHFAHLWSFEGERIVLLIYSNIRNSQMASTLVNTGLSCT